MYIVSEQYIEQMMKRGTRRRLSGTIGSVPFTSNDVVRGSFNISGRATEESDTKIGGVYLGELEMTFVPSFITKVARDAYDGKEVSIYIGLWIPDTEYEAGGYWVDIPCGVYTLESPTFSKEGISVSGYDHMAKLDKRFNLDQTSASPYNYLNYIAQVCGVQLGNTEEEINALPNGNEILGLYPDNDIETFRDLVYWIAQACGCFACADRYGRIVLRRFGSQTGIEVDECHRDNDVQFSGYTTKWTGIYVTDMTTQMAMYYGLEQDDGLTMSLGANPLLQIGSAMALERRRRNVLNAIAEIQFTPFRANMARDPIFDLGDAIPFTGGLSGNSTGCVMAYSYSLDNYSYEGYGDKPTLANARTKNDKNIAGLIQNTTENEVTFYNFVNLEPITFGSEEEVTIASLAFTSAQTTTVKIMHEFLFDLIGDLALDGSYEIHYYFDEQLVPYSPYERIGGIAQLVEGDATEMSITRDFFYIVKEVEPNIRHTWQVRIIAHNIDSVTIDATHARVSLEGQRLYGDTFFDGYIEARDFIEEIEIGIMDVGDISDDGDIEMVQAVALSVTDTIGAYDITCMEVGDITDTTVQVFLEGGYYIATEDGKIITTEDGKGLITE